MKASEGLSNKEIGRMLEISPRTVEIHRAKSLAKLDARNVVQAARLLHQAEEEEAFLSLVQGMGGRDPGDSRVA